MFQIGDLPDWAQLVAIPIAFLIAVLTIVQLVRVNGKLRLEQENLRLENQERRQKLAHARQTGSTAELGEVVEGLAGPIIQNQEATFLLIRFLFLSMVLTFAYAVQGFIVGLMYALVQGLAWIAERLAGGMSDYSDLLIDGSGLASVVQVAAQLAILIIAFGLGWPLYQDVRKFLQRDRP